MTQFADFETRVAKSIEASIAVKQLLLRDPVLISSVARASVMCVDALKGGNKLLLFGNGGSAADAQHIAAEFVGRFAFNRPALPALALSVNSSSLTAIANDYGFDHVFSRQLEALARQGDVAIGFSTSGNSPNVLRGISTAKKIGLHTIALVGSPGGKLRHAPDVDVCICAPSGETPRIQECHTLMGHIVSELVEQELFHAQSRVSGS
jgi:D-sedoheptulose 7-phosphate isomerase